MHVYIQSMLDNYVANGTQSTSTKGNMVLHYTGMPVWKLYKNWFSKLLLCPFSGHIDLFVNSKLCTQWSTTSGTCPGLLSPTTKWGRDPQEMTDNVSALRILASVLEYIHIHTFIHIHS